jgi:hypothetical protein
MCIKTAKHTLSGKADLDGDRSERLLPALNVNMCMVQYLSLAAQSGLSPTVSTLRRSFRIVAIRALRSVLEGQMSVCGPSAISRQKRQWLLYPFNDCNERIFVYFSKTR